MHVMDLKIVQSLSNVLIHPLVTLLCYPPTPLGKAQGPGPRALNIGGNIKGVSRLLTGTVYRILKNSRIGFEMMRGVVAVAHR